MLPAWACTWPENAGPGQCCCRTWGRRSFAVRALVPFVHLVEQRVALVDHQHRAFDALRQMGVGDDDRDLDDALMFRVQARHLAVQPDQIEIRFGQSRGGSGGVGVVHGPNCRR